MPLQADLEHRPPARTCVGKGFASAVLPIVAQTEVRTGEAGLVAGEVAIPAGDFKMPAYRAMPAGRGQRPVVLVVSETFGVHARIADVARRFAQQGYLAIAPELFERKGDASSCSDIPRLIDEVVSRAPDAQVMADLDACVAWAAAHGGDVGRLAVTGFCWGGRITWLYAAHNAAVKAGVAWYGKLVGPINARQTTQPVDAAARLAAPVLGLYGDQDASIPLESVDAMKAALAAGSAAARQSRFVVYPDAPHAFHVDYRPGYRKDAVADGWQRCLAWFKAQGAA